MPKLKDITELLVSKGIADKMFLFSPLLFTLPPSACPPCTSALAPPFLPPPSLLLHAPPTPLPPPSPNPTGRWMMPKLKGIVEVLVRKGIADKMFQALECAWRLHW